ncbi:MAG TPA: SprT family zinc-dependent metalloprotease [Candidatus Saccharimonadales bacterium]|nr:SprT family zinc-dependent metalloprotease [Candidatus Saccharimonadales bacterium]
MSHKQFQLDENTSVTIYKRHASRNLKLSVSADGEVRVSIPRWASYAAGLDFARSRQAWISRQQRPITALHDGMAIGKAHHLRFVPTSSAKPTARQKGSEVTIYYPFELDLNDSKLQSMAEAACERALRQQAEQLLPDRVADLAKQHGFNYRSVSIKKLKSRWGSCDQHKNIVLNLYLMNLPWELIDYVILHELTHTNVLRHGPDFWTALEAKAPTAKQARRAIRAFRPTVWPIANEAL